MYPITAEAPGSADSRALIAALDAYQSTYQPDPLSLFMRKRVSDTAAVL